LNTDKQSTRLLARNFFNQLRSSGYTPTQIIGMATELLDLVTEDIKGVDKNIPAPANEARPDFRQDA
jgi:predicted RNase H-like HicB family nuclease